MKNFSFTDNQQDFIAASLHIEETHINQASQLAFLKIQSWKFALNTSSVGKRFRNEAAAMIDQSFFQFMPNEDLLNREGYYDQSLN